MGLIAACRSGAGCGGRMSLNRSVLAASEREQVSSALSAYARGWFPMYDPDTNVVNWVQPRWRGVIPMDQRFRVSRSLRAVVKSGKFEITSDRAFTEIGRASCRERVESAGGGGSMKEKRDVE